MTVAHLFPVSRGRRGIYRLRFDDGTGYVGRTVDVVRRFGAHRRLNPDLVALEFAPATARADLGALELDEIRAERARGARLRNVVHGTADALADADLDTIITVDEQHALLAGEVVPDDIPERVSFDANRLAQGRPKFRALLAQPCGPWAIEVARAYVAVAVPRPRATEGTFWAASAMASTGASAHSRRLIAVSVNKMETLVLGYDPAEPDLPSGFLNVRRSTVLNNYGSMHAFTLDGTTGWKPRRSSTRARAVTGSGCTQPGRTSPSGCSSTRTTSASCMLRRRST